MRKNKFLLNLIAATALSLSVFGCDSSSSGAVQSTADLSDGSSFSQQQNLHEYFILGQRSLFTLTPSFAAGQSAPTNAPGGVIAGSGDEVIDGARAQMFELVGISERPSPNANIQGPGGGAIQSPTVTAGTTGYHSVNVSPDGRFAICMSRAKNRGIGTDAAVANAELQLFALQFQPFDVTFPPVVQFANPADVTPILVFPVNQGNFVSGLWGPTGQQFYAAINGNVLVFSMNLTTGVLSDTAQTNAFPAGAGGINNAVEMFLHPNGQFLYALDNANNQIVRWDRDATTGQLSNQVLIPTTIGDIRGSTIDRTGNFLYVLGRESRNLGAFRINADGTLTAIEAFANLGTAPAVFPQALGDVDANPQADQLFVAEYRGVLQGYRIDTATGALTAGGAADSLVGQSRNTTNIEVEPTGRFVVTVQESDLEEFQSFVGAPYPEDPIFANIDSATNTGAGIYSPTPMTDANGSTVFALPEAVGQEFTGDVQVFRINQDVSVQFERSQAALNPAGISFFQQVVTPPAPAATGTTTGGTTTP